MKRKLFLSLVLTIILGTGAVWAYLYHGSLLLPFDKKLTDTFFKIRGPLPASDDIVIVDIDEKSLRNLGQWPWPRIHMAKILENLSEAEAAVIGLDIVFSEPDNSSPKKIFRRYGIHDTDVPDYDAILAQTVAQTPTILGYFFDFTEAEEKNTREVPEIPAIFIERNKPDGIDFILEAKNIVPNIPIIQRAAYSSGFFNTLPDRDGIVRSVPLLVRYDDTLYPSISMEMVRILTQSDKVVVDYSPSGVTDIRLDGISLPTDRFGRLLINYRGPGKSYTYLSAVDIYSKNFNPRQIRGKIVLVGTSASGLLDLRATPFDSTFPGVEVHATAIDNMINGDFITIPDWVEAADIAVLLALGFAAFLIFSYASPLINALSSLALFAGFYLFGYFIFSEHHILLNMAFPTLLMILLFFALGTLNYLFEARVKERIREKFAKKVSPQVVEELLKSVDSDTFETKEKEVTIFFSDIRSFTSLSERLGDPKRLVNLLNRYLTPMTDIIMAQYGTIDKFIGDAIMAYWNAPKDLPNHEDAAVRAALMQIDALRDLNHTFSAEGLPRLDIGIGIHTGLVTVGEMGSEGRSDYTIMGDHVNLASRLEGLNKYYGTTLLISETTKRGLKGRYTLRRIDTVRVKGKENAVTIYEVLSTGAPDETMRAEMRRYEKALGLYTAGEFIEAKKIFMELFQKDPIRLYELYASRCEDYHRRAPANFDGVFEFTSK
jgi:adenylate cyclase